MTFDWPVGAKAEVQYSIQGWRENGRSKQNVYRFQHYELEVVARDAGGIVVERTYTGDEIGSSLQAFVDDLPEYVPTLEVDADGYLAAVGGIEEVEARLEKILERSKAGAATRRQVQAFVAEASLQQLCQQTWASLVSVWNGRDLATDFPFGDKSSADMPTSGHRIQVPGYGRLEGWVPCRGGEDKASCVRLTWSAKPVGEDVEEALEAMEGAAVDGLDLERIITVVVDPETLLPYSTVDLLKATKTLPGGGTSSEEMTRRRVFDWTVP